MLLNDRLELVGSVVKVGGDGVVAGRWSSVVIELVEGVSGVDRSSSMCRAGSSSLDVSGDGWGVYWSCLNRYSPYWESSGS